MSAPQLNLEDDAVDKSVADVREEAVLAPLEASGASGSDAPVPASVDQKAEAPEEKPDGDSPELTDQTNFLPTRQASATSHLFPVLCLTGPESNR